MGNTVSAEQVALSYAALHGTVAEVQAAAAVPGVNIDTRVDSAIAIGKPKPKYGRDEVTALHMAVRSGSAEKVRAVLALGASVNAASSPGKATPLITACQQSGDNAPEVLQLLLQAGADPSLCTASGMSALQWACTNITPGAASAVLSSLKAGSGLATRKDGVGQTPLHSVARSGAMVPLVAPLVALGADVNARCKLGITPLLQAAESGGSGMVEALLGAGAAPSLNLPRQALPARPPLAPLHAACMSGCPDSVRALLQAGAVSRVPTVDLSPVQAVFSTQVGVGQSDLTRKGQVVEVLMQAGHTVPGDLTDSAFSAVCVSHCIPQCTTLLAVDGPGAVSVSTVGSTFNHTLSYCTAARHFCGHDRLLLLMVAMRDRHVAPLAAALGVPVPDAGNAAVASPPSPAAPHDLLETKEGKVDYTVRSALIRAMGSPEVRLQPPVEHGAAPWPSVEEAGVIAAVTVAMRRYPDNVRLHEAVAQSGVMSQAPWLLRRRFVLARRQQRDVAQEVAAGQTTSASK